MIDLERYWWPMAPLAELRADRPLARRLHGVPLALFRGENGLPSAVLDRCPHRHAPLSEGRVRSGELECPYHGWRFDTGGRCVAVPGLDHRGTDAPLVRAFPTRSAHDLVWVCTAPDDATPDPVGPGEDGAVDSFIMVDTVRCTIAQAAENFLDGFHTHFVHAGWIRTEGKRQRVRASVHRLPDGAEARYSEEGLQSGFISRLFEGDREGSAGRFRLPGVAEIEYRGQRGLTLLVTAWLTPQNDDEIRIHARVATRRGVLPAFAKRFLARRLFGHILHQDKEILEATSANIARFAEVGMGPRPLDSPLDLLGPAIEHLLTGEPLDDSFEREATFEL